MTIGPKIPDLPTLAEHRSAWLREMYGVPARNPVLVAAIDVQVCAGYARADDLSPGFLALNQIAAADFFIVPTATCRLLFVLVILAHERRRIVHIAVTDHPTAARPFARHGRMPTRSD